MFRNMYNKKNVFLPKEADLISQSLNPSV